MHTLVIQEMGDMFNLEKVMQYGLLPAVISHTDPKKYLESYVQTYIREEVLHEGLTRNLSRIHAFS